MSSGPIEPGTEEEGAQRYDLAHVYRHNKTSRTDHTLHTHLQERVQLEEDGLDPVNVH